MEEIIATLFTNKFLFLAMACFCAAFIDAIAGGGGLISLPAYMATGIPPHVALGTNKVSSSMSTIASSIKFALSGKINLQFVKKIFIFSFLGAILGVRTVILIDAKYFYPLAIVLLVLVLIYTLVNKNLGEYNNFSIPNKKSIIYGRILAFALGFYDGFFGPGTGSFIIFGLIKIFKMDFTNASGNAKILNLTSNLASLFLFIYLGKVNYIYSIPIGFIMIIGAVVGAKVAVLKGNKFIKPIFLFVTSVVLIKMISEAIFHINLGERIGNFFRMII